MDASSLITAVEQLMGPITDMYSQQVKARSEPIKPQLVMIRQYETAVYGFRDQRLPGEVKGVSALLVESLDAFEAGRGLEAGRVVLQAGGRVFGAGQEGGVVVGGGRPDNKAAANTKLPLRPAVPAEGAYEGLYGNSGIKAEKPAPPKPAPAAPASS